MRFTVEQAFDAPADAVARAYADPDLYRRFEGLSKLSTPEVLAHDARGDRIELQIRYQFTGHLSSAVLAVIDPARLSWVEHATHDLGARTTTFRMVPDHYRDRFRCSGSYRFEPDGEGSRRRCEAELKVQALLVAGAVEQAIVSGLREHLADEVPIVERFLGS